MTSLVDVGVEIRDSAAADIARIGQIHFAARWWAYRSFVGDEALRIQDAGKMAAWWRERITYEVPPARMRVAHRDGAVLGFCYSGPSDWPEPLTGMVYAVHVDPAFHRRGIGTALMADALDAMRDSGWTRACLWVLADNHHGRQFYAHQGWAPTGDERDDAMGPVITRQLRYEKTL